MALNYGNIAQSDTIKYIEEIDSSYIKFLSNIDRETHSGIDAINQYILNSYSKYEKVVDNDKMIGDIFKSTAKSRFIFELVGRIAEFYQVDVEFFIKSQGEPLQMLFKKAISMLD